MVGTVLGSYRLLRLLGQGGMGSVYEAIHERIDRHVAIKLLHPQLALNADHLGRFLNEARATNRVDHPGVVQIYDCGVAPDGSAYLIMEYLRGETLRQRIKQCGKALAPSDSLAIARQLAETLAATHAQGIVHRDLKPGNVMLVPDPTVTGGERVKLLDFGIAKLDAGLGTRTGVLMGTPYYIAPEQCRSAGRIDSKADVYSLGILLFELLTGRLPFQASEPVALIYAHASEVPPKLSDHWPDAPAFLESLVARMLAKDPQVRPTMDEVAAACTDSGGDATRAIGRSEAATWVPSRITPSRAKEQKASRARLATGLALVAMITTTGGLIFIGRAARQQTPRQAVLMQDAALSEPLPAAAPPSAPSAGSLSAPVPHETAPAASNKQPAKAPLERHRPLRPPAPAETLPEVQPQQPEAASPPIQNTVRTYVD